MRSWRRAVCRVLTDFACEAKLDLPYGLKKIVRYCRRVIDLIEVRRGASG